MRLQVGSTDSDGESLREFAVWISRVGDGKEGPTNDGEATIDIPPDLLITESDNPIASIVESIYPSLVRNLMDPSYFQKKRYFIPYS